MYKILSEKLFIVYNDLTHIQVLVVCVEDNLCLIFVALGDCENFLAAKISRFTVVSDVYVVKNA